MLTKIIDHFGSVTAMAEALETTSQAISQWGGVVPKMRAYQIEVVTDGKFKAKAILEAQKQGRAA